MRTLRLVVLAAAAMLLGACHSAPDVSIGNQQITLHAAQAPAATVAADGSLSVDARSVPLSAAQRELLARYYANVVAIDQQTEVMKSKGMHMAGEGLRMAARSIKQSVGLGTASSSAIHAQGEAMQAEGLQLKKRALALCSKWQDTRALQKTIADKLEAFQPYADIDPGPPDLNCGTDRMKLLQTSPASSAS